MSVRPRSAVAWRLFPKLSPFEVEPPRRAGAHRTWPGRSTHFWPRQSVSSASIASTCSWNSSDGRAARRRPRRAAAPGAGSASGSASRPSTGRSGEAGVRRLGEVVEQVHVAAQLVGGAGQGRGDARAELLLEHRQHGAAHPDPGEAGVDVVRVVPVVDALDLAGGHGVVAGDVEQRADEPVEGRGASRRASGRRSRGPARAARSRPGRRGCARAAPRPRRSGRRSARARRTAPGGPRPRGRARGRRRGPSRSRSRRRRARPSARRPGRRARPSRPGGRGRR